jgi:NADH:ubiquinone oxidoreductase subunit
MKIKYPRTKHLPWSLGATSDDKVLKDTLCFIDKTVVITEKLDGENSTLARDYYHARSLDSKDHPSRSWIKQFHASIQHEIPEGWRICGENMYARHSIAYDNLKSYFYCFSIWDENNYCIPWNDTVDFCNLLGIEHVPVLSEPFLWHPWLVTSIDDNDFVGYDPETQEGYVIRNVDRFHYDDFENNVAKFVRKNHVQTDQHWMYSTIIPNRLISNAIPSAEKIN